MENTTHGLHVNESPKLISLATDDVSMKMRWAFYFVIFPCVSAVGIAANVTSLVVIIKKDYRKVSNILLIGLATSDIMFLIGLNNLTRNVTFASVPQVLQFSETVNYIFYILFVIFALFYIIGVNCSMLIPVLITGERILAIFTPLTFTRVVTPIRTLVVISCLIVVSISGFIYNVILCLGFRQVIIEDIYVGLFYNTKRYEIDVMSGLYQLIEDLINYLTGAVPIVLVSLGSGVIGVKVILITNKRRQLTSGGAPTNNKRLSHNSVSRTTKTLLSICILYVVCSGFGFVIKYASRALSINEWSLKIAFNLCKDLLMAVNSVGNFIVYVAVNKTFRNVEMGVRWCWKI